MDLIFWRHAEAFDALEGQDDLSRTLTPKGEKQAVRMSQWLDRQLPEGIRVMSSPAVRCEQTVKALGRKVKYKSELLPNASLDDLLVTAGWPDSKMSVLIVGHQPVLGQAVATCWDFQTASALLERAPCGGLEAECETVLHKRLW